MSLTVKRILVLVAMLVVVFWVVPALLGVEIHRIIIGAVAGWQLGTWAYEIAERIFPD